MTKLDDKVKEQTDYLFNQIEPYLEIEIAGEIKVNKIDKDVKRIIYKVLKVFYQEVKKQAITDFMGECLPKERKSGKSASLLNAEFDFTEADMNMMFNSCPKQIRENAKKFIN